MTILFKVLVHFGSLSQSVIITQQSNVALNLDNITKEVFLITKVKITCEYLNSFAVSPLVY